MADIDRVRIVVRPDGPYFVEGEATVIDLEGNEYRSAKPGIALCRCGESATKPFCDGTHKRVGFTAGDGAPRMCNSDQVGAGG
jgi:CDGSH-type Zn-finger protein